MIQLFINVDIKKNASQLIRDLKQLHHSAWIGISLHGFVIVDMLLASYTAHESIWIEYFPALYGLIYIMVTLALAPPDPWVTFDFKSDRSICCSSKISAQSQVVGYFILALHDFSTINTGRFIKRTNCRSYNPYFNDNLSCRINPF